MNRNIEVGCLVAIVAGYNAGKGGTVVGHDPKCLYGYVWAVDAGVSTGARRSGSLARDSDPVWCRTSHLIRIDGGSEEEEAESEEADG